MIYINTNTKKETFLKNLSSATGADYTISNFEIFIKMLKEEAVIILRKKIMKGNREDLKSFINDTFDLDTSHLNILFNPENIEYLKIPFVENFIEKMLNSNESLIKTKEMDINANLITNAFKYKLILSFKEKSIIERLIVTIKRPLPVYEVYNQLNIYNYFKYFKKTNRIYSIDINYNLKSVIKIKNFLSKFDINDFINEEEKENLITELIDILLKKDSFIHEIYIYNTDSIDLVNIDLVREVLTNILKDI